MDKSSQGRTPAKKVFLVAAFRPEMPIEGSPVTGGPDTGSSDGGEPDAAGPIKGGPVAGMAEDVVAVIGIEGGEKRFAWVGIGCEDSIANPAMVTPVKVRLALPSPWHPDGEGFMTGLVQLAPAQLGTGPVEDDVSHLLAELATSREVDPGGHQQIVNR